MDAGPRHLPSQALSPNPLHELDFSQNKMFQKAGQRSGMFALGKSPHCFSPKPCFMSLPEPRALSSALRRSGRSPSLAAATCQTSKATPPRVTYGVVSPLVYVEFKTRAPELGGRKHVGCGDGMSDSVHEEGDSPPPGGTSPPLGDRADL